MPIPIPPQQPPASGKPPMPPRQHSLIAALLSYLVPGLGQIYQGRVSKGVFFLVSLYALFFGGMYLGNWRNVYLEDVKGHQAGFLRRMPKLVSDLYNRPQFAGQFWIGVAAWPAIWQYREHPLPFVGNNPTWSQFGKAPTEVEIQDMQRAGDKTWDLGWIYTVIAGVLNILVIYDAYAGAAFVLAPVPAQRPRSEGAPA